MTRRGPPKKRRPKVLLTIRVSETLLEYLDKRAEDSCISRSELVRSILEGEMRKGERRTKWKTGEK